MYDELTKQLINVALEDLRGLVYAHDVAELAERPEVIGEIIDPIENTLIYTISVDKYVLKLKLTKNGIDDRMIVQKRDGFEWDSIIIAGGHSGYRGFNGSDIKHLVRDDKAIIAMQNSMQDAIDVEYNKGERR